MSFTDDVKYRLRKLNILEKIIVLNVIIFLIVSILSPILGSVLKWLELPSDFNSYIIKPWTIISYAFLHYSFIHLLFNMLWLYFVGRILLTLFRPKTALNIYFLGAIVGGLFFQLGYTIAPDFFKGSGYLIGASAGVRALFIFLCAYMPNKEVELLAFKLKLWYLGAFFVAVDVINIFGQDNQGGYLAHLGGVVLGYIYAKQLLKGNDIGAGFEKMMDWVTSWFRVSKSSNMKTVYKDKTKVGGYTKGEFNQFNNQKKVDVILDKISKSGYESLTAEEKEFLFKAGK
ncbi:rhomboid family intramembrane serine protease [Pontimicrobium sp. MEBiC01747]